jgi:hypothetical protein
MLPYSIIAGGSYTSDATARDLEIQSQDPPDAFIVRDRTKWGDDTAATVESRWYQGMSNGTGQLLVQAVTTGILSTDVVTSNGFTYIDYSNPPTFSNLAGTAITAANPAVVSMASTANISAGDVVRVTQSTGMLQIAGYDFTVGTVVANTSIQLANLDASGFAAPATACQVRKIFPSQYYPRWRYITKISKAAQAVVTFSVNHGYVAGEYISFRVPSQFGMVELNNQQAKIVSVTSSTVTIDLNTTGYTTFAFPSSATAAAGVSPAIAVPSAEFATTLSAAFDNQTKRVMRLGTSVVGANASVMDWVAIKYDQYNGN